MLACCGVVAAAPFSLCHAAQIWFSAPEPGWRVVRHWPANDYMALFEPNAPWQQARADVSVFGFTKRFVLESSEAQLAYVASALKAHHIQIAVQTTPLIATVGCGLGSESFGPPNDMAAIALKLKQAGVNLDYLEMDEPLYFGSFWNGKAPVVACHMPIAEVAREAAMKLKAVREIFPHVIIGDIEPMGITPSAELIWTKDLETWTNAYRQAMGEPLGFLQADVVWQSSSWPFVLKTVTAMLAAQKIPLGIIYNSTPFDTDDAAWIDDAQAHFELVEGTMHIKPAQAIIETWTDFPPQDASGHIARYAD